MAVTGPVPNRSDQRVRRNKDDVQVEKVTASGPVDVPELGTLTSPIDEETGEKIADYHPIARDLYESMKTSGQARYYEPSDWQMARVLCHLLSKVLWSGKPSSQMLAALNSLMSSLLLTEGDRRRVRIEIDRDNAAQDVADAAKKVETMLKERMQGMKGPHLKAV